MNAFITSAVLGQDAPRARPISSLDRKLAAMLLSQAAQIADQLRRMTGSVRDPYHASLIEACRDELAEIRTALLALQGREP